MTAVTPGNPTNSKLYEVINLASGEEKMPPAGSPQLTFPQRSTRYAHG